MPAPEASRRPALESQAPVRALEFCEGVVRAKARNFAWGMRLTPRPRRDALYAAYAWMRAGDDIADDIIDKARASRELAAFRDQTVAVIERCASEAARPEPDGASCWPALAWSIRRAGLPTQPLLDMLDGLAWDLAHVPFETEQELDRYCGLVGGTVGVVCTSVWGVRPHADRDAALLEADLRGKAFQAINIARDVGEDARAGRQYIPGRWLRDEGLTRDALHSWQDGAACTRVMSRLFDRADAWLAQSGALASRIDPACVPTLHAMTNIYVALLEALRRQPHASVRGPRVRVASWRKALLALRALRGGGES